MLINIIMKNIILARIWKPETPPLILKNSLKNDLLLDLILN